MVNKCVVVGCNTNYESMRKKKRDSDGNTVSAPCEKILRFIFLQMKHSNENGLSLYVVEMIICHQEIN